MGIKNDLQKEKRIGILCEKKTLKNPTLIKNT